MRLGVIARICVLVLACVTSACSREDEGEPAASQIVVQIGQKGGRVELREVTLQIPEGALDRELKLSVREKLDPAPVPNTKALSKVYEFGPAGTKFNKEIEVHFKSERDEPAATVFFTKEQRPDEFEKLPTQRDARGYLAKVKHFSAGFVGVDESPAASDGDALDGGAQLAPDAADGEQPVEPVEPADEAGTATTDADGGESSASDAAPQDDAGSAAPDGGGGTPDTSTPRIVLRTFDDVGAPANYTWVAFQDGASPWQRLAPAATEGSYEFDVENGRYGVAVVCADANGMNSRGVVRYANATTVSLRVEISVTSLCRVGTPPPMHTVYGPLTLPSASFYYRYGHANASLLSNVMSATSFIAGGFPGGRLADLIAGVSAAQDGGLTRVMLLRDLMLSDDLQRTFDFASEGIDVGPTYSVLVSNASDGSSVDVFYTTRGEAGGMPMRQGATSTPSPDVRLLSYASIPTALQRADDRYLIVARESDANGGRELTLRTGTASNLNLALPATFSATLGVEIGPYVRPSAAFSDYPGATQYKLSWGFFPPNEQHAFDMLVDADYLSAAGTQVLTFPDLSNVQGFEPRWVPPTDTTEAVSMGASAYTFQQNASGEQTTTSTVGGSYRVNP